MPVLTPTQPSSFRPAVDNHDALTNPPKRKLLLSLAHKLHESEAACTLMRAVFRVFQRFGISISPNHYYWPVPDFRELEKRPWPAEDDPVGMNLGLDEQLRFLENVVLEYRGEWESCSSPLFSVGFRHNNGFFETVDAEIAYCMVRHRKPRRIVEVGGGYSSRVLAAALDQNLRADGVCGELITIDPNPDRFPKMALSDRVHLITEPVQKVDLNVFLSLQDGDFLFLDSSHVVGIGSDVVREYLEIIPRIAGGVLIHAHDIFIPADYPRDAVLRNLSFWSEQYIVQALLLFNPCFEVLWGSSYMQSRATHALDEAFPHWRHSYRNMPAGARRFLPTRDGDRLWPSSFWMKKLA